MTNRGKDLTSLWLRRGAQLSLSRQRKKENKMIREFINFDKGDSPWPQQNAGFEKAKGKPGAMLDMDMRTGKTLVAVALSVHYEARKIVVFAPFSAMGSWTRDFPKSKLNPSVIVLDDGGSPKKLKQLAKYHAGVVVVNYEAAWRAGVADFILEAGFTIAIYDEIHRIKAPGGKASKFCARLRAVIPRRVGLTGTILPNGPLDAYAQFRALDISVFGTRFADFKENYAELETVKLRKPLIGKYGINKGKPINEVSTAVGYKNLEDFSKRMAAITYSCKIEEVRPDIAPIVHEEICFNLPPKVLKIYNEMKTDLMSWVKAGELVTAANILVKTLRLTQIINGHSTNEDGSTVVFDDTKEKILYDFIRDIPADAPVCVYGVFKEDMKAIERVAKKCGRVYGEVSGRRKDLDGDKMPAWVDLMGVQIQSGKEGTDFSRADIGVFYSVNHSGGDFQQACARQRNPNKNNHVTLFHLIARNTISRAIYKALRDKKNLADAIMNHLHSL